jgi:hypothetical protein
LKRAIACADRVEPERLDRHDRPFETGVAAGIDDATAHTNIRSRGDASEDSAARKAHHA